MVENVLFGNSLGHPASSKEKTKEEGGHVVLVLLLCTGQGVGDRGPTGLGGIYGTCRLLILVRKNISRRRWRRRTNERQRQRRQKILDFMRRNQMRGEGGRGTMDCPNTKRGNR